MPGNDDRTILKILSGPHRGAEAVLDSGYKYILGSGDECDIYLEDSGVEDNHAVLQVRGDQVYASPREGGILVGGKEVEGEEFALDPFVVVTVGATDLAVGPEGEEWPEIRISEDRDVDRGGEPDDAGKSEVEGEDRAAEKGGTPVSGDVNKKSRPASLLKLLGLFLFFTGFILVVLFFYTDLFRLETPEEMVPVAQAIDADDIQQTIEEMGFEGFVVEETDRGRLVVRGYVPDAKAKRDLSRVLRRKDPGMRIKVYADTSIIENCRLIVSGFGMPVRVKSTGDGEILLEGTVRNATKLKQMIDALAQDVSGVLAVNSLVKVEIPQVVKNTEQEPYGILIELDTGKTHQIGVKKSL